MIKTKVEYEDVQINLVPMIDMFLFLIIFFLTATSFSQLEREQDVVLPTNTNRGGMSRESEQNLVVNVLSDGGLRFLGRPTTEGELTASLRARREEAPRPLKVLVRADRRTAYANVALALAAVERAGVQRPYLITRPADLGE
jgi:biopolymer transport protein ExbD